MIDVLGFSQPHHVQGRASIADLFRAGKRCGIYILYFANGEFYVGKAEDVTRRYAQHRKTYEDIEKISFKRVAQHKLDVEEPMVVWTLEAKGYPLRNITFASIPKGESDFDLVMSEEGQARWLRDANYVDGEGDRVINPELRRRYSAKFQRFVAMPYADKVIDVLRSYVQVGVPAFMRGELSFWACSCLPGYAEPDVTIYSRINVNWQEVFTSYMVDGELFASLHLALSPLEHAFGPSLLRLLEQYPTLEITDHYYEPGGQDQINLVVQGAEAAQKLIMGRDVVLAIRLFNLRLMKKGPCNFSRYHCMDLADRLLLV